METTLTQVPPRTPPHPEMLRIQNKVRRDNRSGPCRNGLRRRGCPILSRAALRLTVGILISTFDLIHILLAILRIHAPPNLHHPQQVPRLPTHPLRKSPRFCGKNRNMGRTLRSAAFDLKGLRTRQKNARKKGGAPNELGVSGNFAYMSCHDIIQMDYRGTIQSVA